MKFAPWQPMSTAWVAANKPRPIPHTPHRRPALIRRAVLRCSGWAGCRARRPPCAACGVQAVACGLRRAGCDKLTVTPQRARHLIHVKALCPRNAVWWPGRCGGHGSGASPKSAMATSFDRMSAFRPVRAFPGRPTSVPPFTAGFNPTFRADPVEHVSQMRYLMQVNAAHSMRVHTCPKPTVIRSPALVR